MKFAMKIEGIGKMLSPSPDDEGIYLEWFRPENLEKGLPMICFTESKDQARRFDNMAELMECWCTAIGTRADGQPDRPLTAYSISIVTYQPEEATNV